MPRWDLSESYTNTATHSPSPVLSTLHRFYIGIQPLSKPITNVCYHAKKYMYIPKQGIYWCQCLTDGIVRTNCQYRVPRYNRLYLEYHIYQSASIYDY